MDWTPVKKKLPKEPSRVLATILNKETRDKSVVDCIYTREVDTETGEVFGESSFREWINDEGLIDLNNDTYKVTAWMPIPEPYSAPFRVIVTGSRTFNDYHLLCEKLDKVFAKRKPTSIVCGEAKGADSLGRKYAEEHRIPINSCPADWEKHKKQAGYIRNETMAKNADACIAFWDGSSAGTKHMIDTASRMGLQVRVVKFDKERS